MRTTSLVNNSVVSRNDDSVSCSDCQRMQLLPGTAPKHYQCVHCNRNSLPPFPLTIGTRNQRGECLCLRRISLPKLPPFLFSRKWGGCRNGLRTGLAQLRRLGQHRLGCPQIGRLSFWFFTVISIGSVFHAQRNRSELQKVARHQSCLRNPFVMNVGSIGRAKVADGQCIVRVQKKLAMSPAD